jgi:ABC-type branched-subunit amino acid transport system substrate-binding protein
MLMKRGRAVAAVLAIGLMATACSTKAADSSSGGGGSASGGVKTGTGVTADTITVGQLTDLSGVFAALGKSITQAEQLYFDQLSAAGGVCGRKISVVSKDHGYNVQNGVTLYQQMKDQVLGFPQVLGSPISAALLDQYTSDKVIAIPSAWASTLLSNKQIMIVGTTYDYEMINVIDYALENKLIKKGDKIGHIYFEGEYGANGLLGSKYAADKNGLTVVEKKIKPTDTDLTAQVTDLKNQGVTAIALTASPTSTASVAAVDAGIGLNVPILGNNPDFAPGLLKTAAGPALEKLLYGVASWQQPNGTDAGTQKFVADYKAKYPDSQLDGGLTWGYGAAKAFTEVLKKACDNKDLTRDGMNTAFRSLTNVDTGVVAPLDYSKPGASPSQKIYVFRPDSTQAGGLKEVTKGLYAGPTAAGYTPPGLVK